MSTLKVDTYLTRGGASEIAIDKLKGVTAAGSMLVVAEGGTTTTNLQQGLVKAWVNLNGTGTIAIRDSFNVTSCADDGTGQYTVTIANNMADTNYATTSGMARSGLSSCSFLADGSWAAETGSHACICANNGNSTVDVHAMLASFLGDLA